MCFVQIYIFFSGLRVYFLYSPLLMELTLRFDLVIVLVVLAFILVSLYLELLGPAFTFMVAVCVLGIVGVLTPSEILSGFANEQVAVIILLLIIGDIIKDTPVVESLFDRLFRSAKNQRGFLSRMTIIVAGFSSVLNNTPLVAIMMPYVHSWCKRNHISVSKFLIPLSYAAILGGCMTLIGTSTNLIANGLVIEQKIIPDARALEFFDFLPVGLAMTIIGWLYFVTLGNRLLPDRRPEGENDQVMREYIIEAQIKRSSALHGQSLESSGIRNINGLNLLRIIRNEEELNLDNGDFALQSSDILVFAGDTSRISDLLNSNPGIAVAGLGMFSQKKHAQVVEVVVTPNSTLAYKKVHEINFRSRFDATLLALHRNNETLDEKIADISIRPGDVLLMYAGQDFIKLSGSVQDFYFISRIREFVRLEPYKLAVLFGGLLLAIVLSALHIISLFMGTIVVILACLALKITVPAKLPRSVDYNLALIIVMSLALGTAMTKSGVAELIANGMIGAFLPFGKVGVLLGIYLVTTIMAAYITNKAALGLIFPIAMAMAAKLELNHIPFVLAVSYASAANFMTPHGYQTNLMVYGPGGYSFRDFFRIGFPLTVIYTVVAVIILSLWYF